MLTPSCTVAPLCMLLRIKSNAKIKSNDHELIYLDGNPEARFIF